MRSSALRTTLGLACGLVIAVAANDAVAGECPGAGDCCVPNGTPGCDDEVCCSAICANDSFCCDVSWDSICADAANADAVNCPQCQPVPSGACCIGTDCVVVTADACSAKGGSYQGDLSKCFSGGTPLTYESFPHAPLPDDNAAGVSDTITVPDSVTITDVDVGLQVIHTWVGDLCVTLVHQPTGTTVDLIQRMGTPGVCHSGGPFGCAADNFNIVLDDAGAGGPIESQCVFNLSSPPGYHPNNPLAAFNALDSAGDWTLTVSDNAAALLGTFESWSLIITSGGTSACDASCAWDLDGSGDVGILDLLALLAAWGPCEAPCPPDFDGGGTVDIFDLLTLISNWGFCP
ncbi:MAG: hypothetical protein IH983_04305 [Planctomycetes bacterium]|nr:hypothetical protein [Planctomycetota bacterium]